MGRPLPGDGEAAGDVRGLARTAAANDLLVAAAAEALAGGGARQHAHFWAATGLSAELYRREAWREAGLRPRSMTSSSDCSRTTSRRLNAADLLAQLAKWRTADVARHAGGDLVAALGQITARTVVCAFSHDGWFPQADCRAEQELIAGSSFALVQSLWGHYAWGITDAETGQIDQIVGALLAT